jgi:hypothetical protein
MEQLNNHLNIILINWFKKIFKKKRKEKKRYLKKKPST